MMAAAPLAYDLGPGAGRIKRMRILVVEDDSEVAAYVAKGLAEHAHTVDTVADGRDGLHRAESEAYDLLVVDRMLPGLDGLAIVQTLRQRGNHTPVLFLSALADVDDRVKGLRAGGDDYLTKPFSFSELLARVEALGRRASSAGEDITRLQVANLKLDCLARTVERDGENIALQPREFKLLEYLMRHAGQVVTRTMLLEHVWDYHFDPQTNVIDVHISRLRGKIDKGFTPQLLHTVRGAGYVLRE